MRTPCASQAQDGRFRLLNGPCGGERDGKCEVSEDLDCAWQLIYDRLKQLGQLDLLLEPAPLPELSPVEAGR